MSTTDNFDALWSNLKTAVKEAREKGGDRELVYTDEQLPGRLTYGGIVSMNKGDEDGASMYISQNGWTGSINCQPEALRAIAAQCLAAAEEIEEALLEAQAVRPTRNDDVLEALARITVRPNATAA